MIVGLDLAENVQALSQAAILTGLGIGQKPATGRPFDDCRIIVVGNQCGRTKALVGRADHAEKRIGLFIPVDGPPGIEDLVPAVLGVDLCEHHQLGICWISPQALVLAHKIIDLLFRQRKAHSDICRSECFPTSVNKINPLKRR